MTNSAVQNSVSLNELCEQLSISVATGKNWVKLGKITPNSYDEQTPLFTFEYLEELKNSIASGQNSSLKSRRNKKYVSGNNLYSSYVSANSENLPIVQSIVEFINSEEITITDEIVSTIIVYFARQILGENRDFLLEEIINNFGYSESFEDNYPQIFTLELFFEPTEDVLGLLYLSLKNIGARKSQGAYYTPTDVVKKLCSSLFWDKNYLGKSVLDPCCGTGNFILQLPDDLEAENVYASDIDMMSVFITRINYSVKFNLFDKNLIYSNICVCDYLDNNSDKKYDFIIGNPPWGYEFSQEQKAFLKSKYNCAVGANIESYDVVVEQAISELNEDGVLAFVLPEAFLNVKSHTPIRKYLMRENSISYLEYLGDVFDSVQCPSIIVHILHNLKPFSTAGMRVRSIDKDFVISSCREVSANCFNFLMEDEEYSIIRKISGINNKRTLKDNAQFALGIVTGDNSKYISNIKLSDNELILKGSDIDKFRYKTSGNYIKFLPNEFQQVAPVQFYRAKEKLFYKFISNKLVFAYDDKQTLSLNSCNILIPQIEGLSIKYILAVLNSNVAQFFFLKQFNSIKVLRSHLEQIPIPYVDMSEQQEIEKLVDKIIISDNEKYSKLCKILDDKVAKLYNLTDEEILLLSC